MRDHPCVVLRAPTGAGKTTGVPPAIAQQSWLSGKIWVLEPRRVAARAAARFMAQQHGSALGTHVGYHVRFDRRANASTRIEVLTAGIALRRLQADPFLEGVGAVLIDEFHERSATIDLVLAMTRRVQQDARPDLRMLVMSATLDPEPIARWLDHAPIITTEGRSFPVTIEHATRPDSRPVEEQAAQATRSALSRCTGDVLVFLPGVRAIRATADRLRDEGVLIAPLYGDLDAKRQDQALQRQSQRRVVLATNVAETSVTVNGIEAVVDTGTARVLRHDPATGLDRLVIEPIDQASAAQRAGRAGRQTAGLCLRTWTERDEAQRDAALTPELLRADLAGPLLQLRAWGEPSAEFFPWFEAPTAAAIDRARRTLELLGLLVDGRVTELGHRAAALPLHPRLGVFLLRAAKSGAPKLGATAAAWLAGRDPFHHPQAPRPKGVSDLDARARLLLEAMNRGGSPWPRGALGGLVRVRDSLLRALPSTVDDPDAGLGPAALAAWPDRLARERGKDRRAVAVGGRGLRLSRRSLVHSELYVAIDIGGPHREHPADAEVRLASPVDPDWLGHDHLRVGTVTRFDPRSQRVSTVHERRWLDLVLDERPAQSDPIASTEALLQAATARPQDAMGLDQSDWLALRARVDLLREHLPELDLPGVEPQDLLPLLPALCEGHRSFAATRRVSVARLWLDALPYRQRQALDSEAPLRIQVPSGSRIQLDYTKGDSPVLAVKMQELFGSAQTPTIARGRVPVLLHLLAPNGRPQQITHDLESFWNTTWPEVRKDMRRRYPKHRWPEDPWNAKPSQRTIKPRKPKAK